jgi:biopolymer transport protein ExbB
LWCALALPFSVQASNADNSADLATGSAIQEAESSAPVAEDASSLTEATAPVAEAAGQMAEPTSATAFTGHDLSPWGMYQAADIVVKSVMIGLMLASLLTWTVWLFKTVQLFRARRQCQRLLQYLQQSATFTQILPQLAQYQSAETALVSSCQHELALSAAAGASADGLKERLSAGLERVQAGLSAQMNKGTGLLATIGSVAPFVGLFGTVWGIMNSFIGIAETKTTNLAVVAPGIAEALLATAIGLVAAIPAVVIYNHFSRAIGQYRARLTDIATALMIIISRDLDRQEHRDKAPADNGKTASGQLQEAC